MYPCSTIASINEPDSLKYTVQISSGEQMDTVLTPKQDELVAEGFGSSNQRIENAKDSPASTPSKAAVCKLSTCTLV